MGEIVATRKRPQRAEYTVELQLCAKGNAKKGRY